MATNTARLEARISTDLQTQLKRAAEIQGRSVTDFVIDAVQTAVQRAFDNEDLIRLTVADQECFAQALITPAKPNTALKRAFAHRRKIVRDA